MITVHMYKDYIKIIETQVEFQESKVMEPLKITKCQ